MQKLQNLLPLSTIPNLPSPPLILIQITRETFFTILTIICTLTLHAVAFINTKYFSSSQKIMQEKYVKGTLAKLNSGELAEDQLKKVRTAKLKRVSRRKLGNKVI